tara:strand:+ start:90539 stop:91210 length:672 start_codon:yes stop_codon:yes gene_type:complete
MSTVLYSQGNIDAKILTKVRDNLIGISAMAQNNNEIYKDDYSYLLFSLKKGTNGNYSNNSQSGKFSLEPFEEKELSKLKVNIQENEEISVFLFLRKDGVLISKDSIKFYAVNQKKKKVDDESSFAIKGIVVDESITKVGKDFHEYFYQIYSLSGNKHPFIIVIREKPSFGRSSIISIEVDENKIFEFNSTPDEEYLRTMAISSLQKINIYAKQKKILFNSKKM